MSNQCDHGHLRRSCEICQRDEEIEQLKAERDALQNTKHYEAPRGFVLNPDYLVPELRAQRDALLEACRAMLTFIERHAPRGLQPEPGSPVAMARAAIKAVEGEKK